MEPEIVDLEVSRSSRGGGTNLNGFQPAGALSGLFASRRGGKGRSRACHTLVFSVDYMPGGDQIE